MDNSRQNLNKLKELCDALTDRDTQLKTNASALWEILEVVSSVRGSLSKISAEDPEVSAKILECSEMLKGVECILDEKGCKKVTDGH